VAAAAALAAVVAGLGSVATVRPTTRPSSTRSASGVIFRTQIQADQGVPNLIVDMNNADLQFTINDGDLKAG